MSESPIRALIVDDEPLARARLRDLLVKHRDVEIVGECVEGSDAIAVIGRERPDVVFLDVQMTEISGIDVAQSLGGGPLPAVVFVTAYERYALDAFDARALDYLLKPFEEDRFLATLERVRTYTAALRTQRSHEHLLSVLRELSAAPHEEPTERRRSPALPLRFADLEVDTGTHDVRRAGEPVSLRPKEYELLVALMRRSGALATRRELLAEVWGYSDDVSSRTVDTHVAVLRRKLGHGAEDPGYIMTVAKAGYRLRQAGSATASCG
jgi:DNA-binding response OmpR family regulator